VAAPSPAQRAAAAIAAGAALGLAIAHLVMNLSQLPAEGSIWLLIGPVLTPSALAGLLAVAAVSAGRHRNTPKAVRIGLILGASVMWALAITMLV
jgi:hypothetical protein